MDLSKTTNFVSPTPPPFPHSANVSTAQFTRSSPGLFPQSTRAPISRSWSVSSCPGKPQSPYDGTMPSKSSKENRSKSQARSISSENLWTKKSNVVSDPFLYTAGKSASLSSIHRYNPSRNNTTNKPAEIPFLYQPITQFSRSKTYAPFTTSAINSPITKHSSSVITNTVRPQVANHPTATTFCTSQLPVTHRTVPLNVSTSMAPPARPKSRTVNPSKKISTLPSARAPTSSSIAYSTSQTIKSSFNPISRNNFSPDRGSFASSIAETAPSPVKRTSSWPDKGMYASPTKRMHASTKKSEFHFPIKYPCCILSGASLGEAKSNSILSGASLGEAKSNSILSAALLGEAKSNSTLSGASLGGAKSNSNVPSSQHVPLHSKAVNFRRASDNNGEQHTGVREYYHQPTNRPGHILQDAGISNTQGNSNPTTSKTITDSFSVEVFTDSDSPRSHRTSSSCIVNISPEPAVADTKDLNDAKGSNQIHANSPHIIRRQLFPSTKNVGNPVRLNHLAASINFQPNVAPSFPNRLKTSPKPNTYYGNTTFDFSEDEILDCSTGSKRKTENQAEVKMPNSRSSSNLTDNYKQRTVDLVNTARNVVQTSADLTLKNGIQHSGFSHQSGISKDDSDYASFANEAANILRILPRHIANECKGFILQFLDQTFQYSAKNGFLED